MPTRMLPWLSPVSSAGGAHTCTFTELLFTGHKPAAGTSVSLCPETEPRFLLGVF